MRFEKFLIEGRSDSIDEFAAMEIIANNCMKAYRAAKDKKAIIYRGVSGKRETMQIDPKKGSPRRSANTSNYYTLWMDNMGFKEYPKRSRSVIASTDLGKAQGYGRNTYVLLPEDGANIGVVSENDIFNVGNESVGLYMGQLNTEIRKIIELYMSTAREFGATQFDIARPWDRSWEVLKKTNEMINKINKDPDFKEAIENKMSGETSPKFYSLWWNSGGDIFGVYKKALDKKYFKLKKAGDAITTRNNEVWTDGYCVLIDVNLWIDPDFHEELKGHIK